MSPCRGPGGWRAEPLDPIIAGKGVADLDQTDPQAVSKLGQPARRSNIVLIGLGANLTFVGQVGDSVADEDGELPGTTVHGGLLHGLGLLIGRAASPGRVNNSYILGLESAASSRRSASSTSSSPRSTASRTAKRTASSCAAD
jgi:hypothetical protein